MYNIYFLKGRREGKKLINIKPAKTGNYFLCTFRKKFSPEASDF